MLLSCGHLYSLGPFIRGDVLFDVVPGRNKEVSWPSISCVQRRTSFSQTDEDDVCPFGRWFCNNFLVRSLFRTVFLHRLWNHEGFCKTPRAGAPLEKPLVPRIREQFVAVLVPQLKEQIVALLAPQIKEQIVAIFVPLIKEEIVEVSAFAF